MLDCKPIESRTTAEDLFKLVSESVERFELETLRQKSSQRMYTRT